MTRNDTIAAIATPHGRGGIAVVRVSGPDAVEICSRIWRGKALGECGSHTAHLGNVADPATGDILDQAVATVFRAPGSYTGEDTVELSVHGSQYVQAQLLKILIDNGCRLADAGEFTRRAFVAGHMDLAEAEAVADLIAATSRSSHRIALNQMRGRLSETLAVLRERLLRLSALLELELDFSEEDVEFASRREIIQSAREIITILDRLTDSFAAAKAIRDGVPLAIVGAPNAGKSTLLNTLVDDERAIVSPIPGTTRDIIEDTVDIDGTLFRIIDTAGIRHNPSDSIERIGIGRTKDAVAKATVVVWVIDPTDPASVVEVGDTLAAILKPDTTLVVAINKSDICAGSRPQVEEALRQRGLLSRASLVTEIVALDAATLAPMLATIGAIADPSQLESAMLTNARHYQAALRAQTSMRAVVGALTGDSGPIALDLIALDLRDAIHHLGEITGAITTPDILATIFATFCIGK